ncbi:MAG: pitrilysin family protein [Alphaproteobacteria bacterium]|nr:pitrilysin family protein [Alphaproteobacteria bacterium]
MTAPPATAPTISTLANGLRVACDPMDGVETVSLGLWVGVGARDETKAQNGVSHLLEHMAFKGTEKRTARDIAEEIEAVGGHLNAYTTRESTAFYAKVLKEHVPLAIDILADILQNSLFDEDELARERDVVLQEIGQARDTPDDVVFDHFQETAYPDQPLGRPVLGRPEIVEAMPRETLRNYMSDGYGADRMILAAAGRIDHDTLSALAEQHLAGLQARPGNSAVAARYQGGEYRHTRKLEQAHIVFGLPGIANVDTDIYALGLFSTMLGGGMSSRLFQEVREKRGLVYSIYSFSSAYRDGGLFGVYAGTGADKLDELTKVVAGELVELAQSAGEEEISRARAQMRASVLMSREGTGARAEQLAGQMLVFGRPIPVAEILTKIDEVDRAAIERIGARLTKGPLTLAALGPIKALPAYDDIAGQFNR